MTNPKLEKLLEMVRKHPPTPEDLRETRISFAYGNTKIENEDITREMIVAADRKIFG